MYPLLTKIQFSYIEKYVYGGYPIILLLSDPLPSSDDLYDA